MLLRLIKNRWKEYWEFKWEIINILIGDITNAIISSVFWIFTSRFLTHLGVELYVVFLFLFFQWLTVLLFIPFYSSARNFIYEVRSGNFSRLLIYPINWKIYIFVSKSWIPFGPLIQLTIYLLLALNFGLKVDINFFLGVFLSIFAAFVILSIFFLSISLSLYFESEGFYRTTSDILWTSSKYPTFLYKGAFFILTNFFLPGFLLGSLQVFRYVNLPLFPFISLGCLICFISLFLGNYVISKWLRRYESYGV